MNNLKEVKTRRDRRPCCKFCGFDGNLHTMRKYRRIMPNGRAKYEFACDMCGHECSTVAQMKREILSYQGGFSDYTVHPF